MIHIKSNIKLKGIQRARKRYGGKNISDAITEGFQDANHRFTPRKTGRLQRSMRIRKRPYGANVRWNAPYAKFVERRRPFLRHVVRYAVRKINRQITKG